MENLRCFSFYVLLLSLRVSVIARMWHKSTLKGFRWKRCSVNMFLSFALKISESPKQWPNTLPEESLHTNHRHNMKHRKNEKRYKKSLHTNHHQNQQNLKLNLGKPSKNIARGTSDPGIASITWLISPATKQANSVERKIQHSIGSNFDHQVALTALVPNLPTRWRHLPWLQICISSKFGHQMAPLAFS